MTHARLAVLILAVAAATFALRFVPMALVRRPIRNKRIVAFVGFLPYSILAAMTIPGIFSSAGGTVASSAGFVTALALALAGKSLPVVAAAAAAVALALSTLPASAAPAPGPEGAVERWPEPDEAAVAPAGAGFGIAPDGTFLVGGVRRHLVGPVFYIGFDRSELRPGPGYAPEDAWIYESDPNANYLRRLGFDTVGGEVSASWMRRFRPEPSFHRAARVVDWNLASNWWHAGFPAIVDFTAATWSHGGISHAKGREPAAEAFVDDPDGACHFMSYSLVTPEGRDVWRLFWRTGAEELRANGVGPYAFELFNEPRYDDRSPGARKAFAEYLARKFGSAAEMDAAWGSSFGSFEEAAAFGRTGGFAGLGVEWLKFREAAFEDGVRLGRDTIREVYPGARVCYQPLSRSVDVDRVIGAESLCGVVMSPTGGGDPWDDMRLLALADGKPFVDGETYLGRTRASHRAAIVRQRARGIDASYVFKWERRLKEMPDMDEATLHRLAARFPWLELDPAAVPTEALAGIMDAKRDIAAVQDLFGPRDRGIPPAERVAVLVSLPTARLAEAAGLRCHAFEREAALALANGAHVPVDAIFEEQLPEGRLDRYKVLVAAGVAATSPATRERLLDWAERGGTLILVGEAMELDEYARPSPSDFPGIALGNEIGGEPQSFRYGAACEAVPYREADFSDGWNPVASFSDGRRALVERRFGDGRVFYLGARFPNPVDEAGILAALAADCGIRPTCATLDPATGDPVDDIEVHAARGADGDVGFIVENRSLAAKAVRFIAKLKPHAESAESPDGRAPSRPERASGAAEAPVLLDVTRRTILGSDTDGAVLLLLEPSVPVVLRGIADVDHSAFGIRHSAWPVESYLEVENRIPSWLAAHMPSARVRAKAFSVDPARVKFLDLRDAATVSYGDAVADDGKGGWTDQGANCMENAPWGVVDCNGVPFDFIRPDQNGGRATVILRSKRQPWLPEAVRGIVADFRAEALFFLHAGAFVERDAEAFRYVVRYADGSSIVLPMRGFREFDDWWPHGSAKTSLRCVTGWLNGKGRGFHVLRWENPFPERTIATIDVESADSGTVPIVQAVTALLARGDSEVLHAETGPVLRAWGSSHAEAAESAEAFAVSVSFAGARDWAGVEIAKPGFPEIPASAASADLEFDLVPASGLPLPPLQLRVGEKGGFVHLDSFIRESGVPGAWRVSFPLDLAEGGMHAPIRSFSLQLRGKLPEGTDGGFVLSSPRVVVGGTPDGPLGLRRLQARGMHGVSAVYRDGGLELAVSDASESWSGAKLTPVRPVPLPADAASAALAFEANAGRTPLGSRDRKGPRFRVRASVSLADGTTADGPWLRDPPVENGRIDDDPWSWQTVRIPLSAVLPPDAAGLAALTIQFTGLPTGAERTGLAVRDFRFETSPAE